MVIVGMFKVEKGVLRVWAVGVAGGEDLEMVWW